MEMLVVNDFLERIGKPNAAAGDREPLQMFTIGKVLHGEGDNNSNNKSVTSE